MYVCVPYACQMSREAEEDIRSPGTGITDGCKLLCGYWEVNPGPLEQLVLFTTEPSLQPEKNTGI